jgi:hypothetical protein
VSRSNNTENIDAYRSCIGPHDEVRDLGAGISTPEHVAALGKLTTN